MYYRDIYRIQSEDCLVLTCYSRTAFAVWSWSWSRNIVMANWWLKHPARLVSSPQTHTHLERLCLTHGKGWCVSWASGWSCCQRCEFGRRSWPRSERSARFSSPIPSRSNPRSARAGAAGDPGSWGTSLPSSPSRQTPARDTLKGREADFCRGWSAFWVIIMESFR